MELRHLRSFSAVARTLNLTRAADELHYAQSSVTEQIQALETELGTPLFDRTGRRLRLTGAGERLVDYAHQVLLLVEEARAAVDEQPGEPAGELVLGALETLCAHRVPVLFTDYRTRWPKVAVTVRQGDRGYLYEAVRGGSVDVALTFGAAPADPALASEVLAHDRLVVVVPPGHRLAALDEVGAEDLRGLGFLATPPGCGFRAMLEDALLGDVVIEAEVASLAAMCGCVASGTGCALVPETAARDHVATGRLVAIPLHGKHSRAAVTMTWLRRSASRPSVAAMLVSARAAFAAQPVA
ncbi:LysR family transcriptional regulator [Umezawaea sp. Da 62-37]|uniref:LysR family transcriptional regulator n=1 Tax=Umezawaea sp. Da 62-37 TaxID=3075927 RepID=UPI0028F7210A|nr:LysR family transcriptional regulator [Umezawaea sp. Da 62-37]WNV83579.1 LysR family transcriptional regulator [Umezawaea sp. Da 62-37]